MRFENIEVGDEILYDGLYSKVVMKDEKRMVIDGDNCYISDLGKCSPIDLLWETTVEQMGYTKYGVENGNSVFKKIIGTTASALDPRVIVTLRKNSKHEWFLSISVTKGLTDDLCFEKLVNIPVKYTVQVERMEEAFRIVATENL